MEHDFRGGPRPVSTGPRPSRAGPCGFQTDAIDSDRENLKLVQELAKKLHASRLEIVKHVGRDIVGKLKADAREGLGLAQNEPLPRAVSQAIIKHVKDSAAIFDDPNADTTANWQALEDALPQKLTYPHDMLLIQFQNALKKYLTSKSRQDSRSTPFSPQRAKDDLSNLWELGLVLTTELGVSETMGSSEAGNEKLRRSLMNITKSGAWKALEIMEAAYKAWMQNPKSEALQERLAEATALLDVFLLELTKFEPMDNDDTINMIARKMKSFSS